MRAEVGGCGPCSSRSRTRPGPTTRSPPKTTSRPCPCPARRPPDPAPAGAPPAPDPAPAAFNRELCAYLGVAPLAFDGVHDAIFQEYGPNGRFMEYVHDHGSFDTLPFEQMIAAWRTHYARMPDTWDE